MRRGAKQNSILNSPIVRSLINKKQQSLPPPPPPAPTPVTPPTPDKSYLIQTQPTPAAPSSPPLAAISISPPAAGHKRKRDSQDEGEPEDDKEAERTRAPSIPAIAESVSTNVVVKYTSKNLPKELRKYWAQRYRLFTLFDEGVHMDLEGWYSVTPELIAVQIAERCRSGVVLDAFCGVGGNAIQFAFTCERVIAIDNSPVRLACAAHNAKIYDVADRITFILGDFLEYAKEYSRKKGEGTLQKEDEIEVVFLSPPWGGIGYRDLGATESAEDPTSTPSTSSDPKDFPPHLPGSPATPRPKKRKTSEADSPSTPSLPRPSYPLSALAPIHGAGLFSLARGITPHVAYYLPRNVDIHQISELAEKGEQVEIEEEWMGSRLKAVTAYFGDLATRVVGLCNPHGYG